MGDIPSTSAVLLFLAVFSRYDEASNGHVSVPARRGGRSRWRVSGLRLRRRASTRRRWAPSCRRC